MFVSRAVGDPRATREFADSPLGAVLPRTPGRRFPTSKVLTRPLAGTGPAKVYIPRLPSDRGPMDSFPRVDRPGTPGALVDRSRFGFMSVPFLGEQ